MKLIAERNRTHAELLAVVGVDHKRHLQLAKSFISRVEDNLEIVLTGSNLELILVVEGLLLKLLQFLLAIKIKVDGVAEAGGNRAVRLIGDAEHVNRRMLLPLHFLKLQRVRRNADGQIHPRRIWGNVKERSLHSAGNISGHLTRGVSLHLLLNRVSREQVLRSLLAISTAGADDSSAAIDFHFQRMASAFGRLGRSVAQHIILGLVVRNSLQAADQIVGIYDDKPARALGQLIEELLVVGDVRNNGDDLPRLIELRVPVAWACDG